MKKLKLEEFANKGTTEMRADQKEALARALTAQVQIDREALEPVLVMYSEIHGVGFSTVLVLIQCAVSILEQLPVPRKIKLEHLRLVRNLINAKIKRHLSGSEFNA